MHVLSRFSQESLDMNVYAIKDDDGDNDDDGGDYDDGGGDDDDDGSCWRVLIPVTCSVSLPHSIPVTVSHRPAEVAGRSKSVSLPHRTALSYLHISSLSGTFHRTKVAGNSKSTRQLVNKS